MFGVVCKQNAAHLNVFEFGKFEQFDDLVDRELDGVFGMQPIDGLRDSTVWRVKDEVSRSTQDSVSGSKESRDLVRPQMFDHLAAEYDVDALRLNRPEVSERCGNPFDALRKVVRRRRKGLNSDVTLDRGGIVRVKPFEIPAASGPAAQHDLGPPRESF